MRGDESFLQTTINDAPPAGAYQTSASRLRSYAVTLAWLHSRPGATSTIIGCTNDQAARGQTRDVEPVAIDRADPDSESSDQSRNQIFLPSSRSPNSTRAGVPVNGRLIIPPSHPRAATTPTKSAEIAVHRAPGNRVGTVGTPPKTVRDPMLAVAPEPSWRRTNAI